MERHRDLSSWLEPTTWLIPRDQHYLFLLSHMRSYSSVLAHVLGNSPEINGCGETHLKYRRRRDLYKLRFRVRRSTGAPLYGRWLLDKILHNHIRPPERLIDPSRTRTIVFMRAPEKTLRSIINVAHHDPGAGALRQPEAACDYYVTRLHRLRTDAERLGRQAIYFDSEALIATPRIVLDALSDWLELHAPLTSEYRTCLKTGTWGFGDPLQNIFSGRIVTAEHSTIAAGIHIPRLVLAEAQTAYWRCKEAVLKNCESVHGGVAHGELPCDLIETPASFATTDERNAVTSRFRGAAAKPTHAVRVVSRNSIR